MVLVTDKQYYLDGFVEQIGDAVADRVQSRKQDLLVLFNGREGSGKTNASIAFGYYVAWKTGRKFDNTNIFFDIDKMMEFAGTTKEQIILWDESAMGGLAHSWSNSSQKKLKSMLMMCRKLRHVFIFNIPRFYRLASDLIERTYCMFHIYENKEEKPGNFMFFGQQGLEILYEQWKKSKYANYWKYKKLHGHFSWVLPQLIDEDAYENEKDKAIKKLVTTDEKKVVPKDIQMKTEAEIIKNMVELGYDNKTIGNVIGKHINTVIKRKKLAIGTPVS